MIKSTALLVRRAPMDHDSFVKYWIGTHGKMVVGLPGLRGFIQSKIVDQPARADIAPVTGVEVDGMAQNWFDDVAGRNAFNASPGARKLLADGAVCIGRIKYFLHEEHVFVRPRRGRAPVVKLVELLARKDGASREDFLKTWLGAHAPTAAGVPGIRGHLADTIFAEPTRPDIEALPVEIDGIAETWFDSREACAQALAGPEMKKWRAAQAGFVGRICSFLTEEQIFIDPPMQASAA